jgi:hypothetical protein
MQTVSRIPKLSGTTYDSALIWFSQLHCNGFLFHPEDDQASICSREDGENMFSENEVIELRLAISELESSIGHDAINEAAYPIFMKAAGIRLNA